MSYHLGSKTIFENLMALLREHLPSLPASIQSAVLKQNQSDEPSKEAQARDANRAFKQTGKAQD